MLPEAVARSSNDGVAIRYVLPVLQITSCFHTMGPIGGRMGTGLCTGSPVVAGGAQASSLAAQAATNTLRQLHHGYSVDSGGL